MYKLHPTWTCRWPLMEWVSVETTDFLEGLRKCHCDCKTNTKGIVLGLWLPRRHRGLSGLDGRVSLAPLGCPSSPPTPPADSVLCLNGTLSRAGDPEPTETQAGKCCAVWAEKQKSPEAVFKNPRQKRMRIYVQQKKRLLEPCRDPNGKTVQKGRDTHVDGYRYMCVYRYRYSWFILQ